MEEDSEDETQIEVELKVTEAKQHDVGRSIVRLDSEIFQKLQIRTGDIVRIKGKNRITAAIVWPAYPEDQNQEIIRMDGRSRKNIGVTLDEKVIVSKASEKPAREILIAPTNVKLSAGDPYVESFIKRKLLNYPVTQGDVIHIPIGIAREVPFQILQTKPKGTVIVKQSTLLRVSENPEEMGSKVGIITFDDIGGLGPQIQILKEVLKEILVFPELFKTFRLVPPKGILLYGPSGCGKTMIGKALANESEMFFKSIDGAEIISKFQGETEKRLRTIFDDAKKRMPSIIFIDHLDSLASIITESVYESDLRVKEQLLELLDGLKEQEGILVIGATHRLHAIDPEFRRPGRFDREIEIGIPNQEERKEILQIYTRNIPLGEDVDLDEIANQIEGFVGADIAALAREATIIAIKKVAPITEWENIKIQEENSEIINDMIKKIKVINEDFEIAIKLLLKDKKTEQALQYIKKIASIYSEISIDKISYKTGISIYKLENLIEEAILKGEIQGEIKENRLIFKFNKNDSD
jgi:transitional endoplasmic reticulum ATPase